MLQDQCRRYHCGGRVVGKEHLDELSLVGLQRASHGAAGEEVSRLGGVRAEGLRKLPLSRHQAGVVQLDGHDLDSQTLIISATAFATLVTSASSMHPNSRTAASDVLHKRPSLSTMVPHLGSVLCTGHKVQLLGHNEHYHDKLLAIHRTKLPVHCQWSPHTLGIKPLWEAQTPPHLRLTFSGMRFGSGCCNLS